MTATCPEPAVSPAASKLAVVRPGDRVMVSGRGLQLPRRLPFERWLGIGRQLSAVTTSAAWCLGDWLAFGEKAYAGRYREAIEQTSLDYQTLRNYAWVARRFALSRRRDTLSFGHHAEVAALPEPEQDYWLRQAEQHHWPVKQLRHQVHNSLSERSRGQHNPPAQTEDPRDWVILRLQLRLTADQLQTCQAAANNASLSLEAWTILAVEHAARHELTTDGKQREAGT
jgi:hypothetical protein